MKRNDIAVGVVTYNRLELLKKVITGLRNQTVIPDKIFVINNSSTDGTEKWLLEQTDLTVIKQNNLGSSGGQYRSIKAMFDAGYEWIWIMDDDVVPVSDCLENLIDNISANEIRVPLRWGEDGAPFFFDTIEFNMKNPFKTIWTEILSKKYLENKVITAQGITFEGPIFHRSVMEKIGLPQKDFFIFADDTEYMMRAQKHGFKTMIMRDARLDRLLKLPDENKFSWKHYYIIRLSSLLELLSTRCTSNQNHVSIHDLSNLCRSTT